MTAVVYIMLRATFGNERVRLLYKKFNLKRIKGKKTDNIVCYMVERYSVFQKIAKSS